LLVVSLSRVYPWKTSAQHAGVCTHHLWEEHRLSFTFCHRGLLQCATHGPGASAAAPCGP